MKFRLGKIWIFKNIRIYREELILELKFLLLKFFFPRRLPHKALNLHFIIFISNANNVYKNLSLTNFLYHRHKRCVLSLNNMGFASTRYVRNEFDSKVTQFFNCSPSSRVSTRLIFLLTCIRYIFTFKLLRIWCTDTFR